MKRIVIELVAIHARKVMKMEKLEIYTGYYANLRKYLAGGCAAIGISVGTPSYLKGNPVVSYMRWLGPTYDMLDIEDEAEYTRQYRERILAKLDYRRQIAKFHEIASAQDKSKVVLLCYEKPPKFCHRSLLAEWINSHHEFSVGEYGYAQEAATVPQTATVPAPAAKATGVGLVQPDLFSAMGVDIPRIPDESPSDWR